MQNKICFSSSFTRGVEEKYFAAQAGSNIEIEYPSLRINQAFNFDRGICLLSRSRLISISEFVGTDSQGTGRVG